MSQLCCMACPDDFQLTSYVICMTQRICSLSVWSCVVLLGQSLWTLKQDKDNEFNVLDPQSYQLFWAQSQLSWNRWNKETEKVVGRSKKDVWSPPQVNRFTGNRRWCHGWVRKARFCLSSGRLCTAVVNETRFICSNDGTPFLLTFYKASVLFFEAGVVAQRYFDPSLLLPQKNKNSPLLSLSHNKML